MPQPDVLIIGGGVIGCAIAYTLTHQCSLRVLLLERATLGSGATNAAAGLLAVASSHAPGGVLFELRRRSAALFPELVARLRAESGIDPEYRQGALLELGFSGREGDELQRLVQRRREQQFDAELLDAGTARQMEPLLSEEVRVAARFGGEHCINSERLTAALAEAARRRGAEVRLNAPVTGFETAGTRVLRVRSADEWICPGAVVLAAGTWSVEIAAQLRVRVPLRPARGEMLALRPSQLPNHFVTWDDGYLIPRADGELHVGSTVEYTDCVEVTAAGAALLKRRALQMMPALADAPVVRRWAGLRPCPTIRRPIIGPVRGFENLILATGHHRNGVLLAPVTGQLVTELLTTNATSLPLQPFSYRPR
ncbi:MAG: glycine oxidase ThiO [Deltaproteobacteria bacterium]|nr:glycine oxidase ThiO [Deltaproteobacteria bacterium]